MPVITIHMHKTEPAVKADLIRGLTAAAVEVTKLPAQSYTVFVQELDSDNIGLGGKVLTDIYASR